MLISLGIALSRPAWAVPACALPGADCTLREIASQVGFFVGAALEPGPLQNEPVFAATLADEFNSLTAENRMKWPQVHPQPGVWNLPPADTLVDFAEQEGMRVRGHTLVWSRTLVPYIEQATSAEELRSWTADHIGTLVGAYAGRVAQWDVVNEPLALFNNDLQPNVYTEQIGTDYIAEAFQLAHAADPTAKLYLNEVLIEFQNSRFNALHALVADLVAQGVPIHGVGLQGHFIIPPIASHLQANLQALVDLGLEVEITELDIAISLFPGTQEEKLAAQRQAYYDVFRACLAVDGCTGITTWGVGDAHTWLGSELEPLLFDESYAPKPAYFGARQALLEHLIEVPEPGVGWLVFAGLILLRRATARR